MAYPCGCTPSVIDNPPCSSGTCLKVPNLTISEPTSVLPCGGSGFVDIGTLSTLTACSGSIVWQLLSYDTTAFASASIDSAGVLTFQTNATVGVAVVGKYYEFVIVVMCSNSLLSVQRVIRVPIRNACRTQVCDGNFHCNPCNGGCVADTVDIEIS